MSKYIASELVVSILIFLLAFFMASLLRYQRPGSPWNIYKNPVMVKWQDNDGDLTLSINSNTGYLYARKKVDLGFTFVYKEQRYRVVGYEGTRGDQFTYLIQSDME